MSDTVIQIKDLSKQYRLGEVSTGSLHHDINRWWHRARGKEDPYLKVTHANVREQRALAGEHSNADAYVWALRDVCLEVRQGDVLGIIGSNGAGKSTLLKILSQVTAPTAGEVRIKGRIASLLEVGTGFQNDLTGRENIFLNGAILGMTKVEIRRKFDEIVQFSGCEAYIDTPVKRFSSGMLVRLAFAVAAHLEPEILVLDEVLAVGDAEFQRKCLGKMSEVANQGRTVLFVSHNMSAVQKLCPQSIVLSDGRLAIGPLPSKDAVHEYLGMNQPSAGAKIRFDRDDLHLEDVRLVDKDGGEAKCPIPHDEDHGVQIHFSLDRYDPSFRIGFELFSQDGDVLFVSMSSDGGPDREPRIAAGRNCLRSVLPAYLLNEGDYQIGIIAYYHGAVCLLNPHKENVRLPFSVRLGPGLCPDWNKKRLGPVAPLLRWESSRGSAGEKRSGPV